MILDKTF